MINLTQLRDCGYPSDDDPYDSEECFVPEYLTTAAAAKRLKITAGGVRRAILGGTIPAKKFGKVWMVDVTGLKPRRVGRPRSEDQRCKCGAMTLVRALTRGVSHVEHKRGCDFYAGKVANPAP